MEICYVLEIILKNYYNNQFKNLKILKMKIMKIIKIIVSFLVYLSNK